MADPENPRSSSQGDELGDLLNALASRVEEAAAAAERAVEGLRADTKARRSVLSEPGRSSGAAERERVRVARELVDTVIDRSTSVVKQYARIGGILERAARELGYEGGAKAAPRAPADAKAGPPRSKRSRGRVSEGVRLITTQMAVAGSSREQIEERLRDEFGIKNAAKVVQQVLGRETKGKSGKG